MAISQHKQIAMGRKAYKTGGLVIAAAKPYLKTGKHDSPLETAKRNNGIPGFKKGGKCSCGQ